MKYMALNFKNIYLEYTCTQIAIAIKLILGESLAGTSE